MTAASPIARGPSIRVRRSAILWVLAALVACAPDPELRQTRVELRLPTATSCLPDGTVDRVLVEALGDFPALGTSIEILRPASEAARLDRLPFGTRALVVTASSPRWEGVGTAILRDSADAELELSPITLLPTGPECGLGDPLLAERGQAFVPRGDGGVFVIGGTDESRGLRRMLLLSPGQAVGEDVGPMEAARVQPTAAMVGRRLVVASGSADVAGAGEARIEVFDEFGTPERVLSLSEGRRHAALVALDGQRAMLIGGRASADGPPLDTSFFVNASSGEIATGPPLPAARAGLLAYALGDGALAFGGVSLSGAAAGEVFVFEGDSWRVLDGLRLPAEALSAAVMPDGRIVVSAAANGGTLHVIRPGSSALGAAFALDEVDVPEGAALSNVRLAGLPDGRLLMTGLAEGPAALVIDVARGQVDPLPARDQATVLRPLAGGAVFAAGPLGASLRRVMTRTSFDQPPATLIAEDYVLDGPGRWRENGARLEALAGGARASLTPHRFADFALSLRNDGLVDLVLTTELGESVVTLRSDRFGPALCEVARAGAVSLMREEGAVVIESGGESRRCALPLLVGPASVAFVAQAGAAIESVAIQRTGTP
ncbi:MAG: hypothetical protein AAF645_16910 [Myxococcota bacterium]